MDAVVDQEDEGALARRIVDAAPRRDGAAEAALCRRMGPRIRLFGLRNLRDETAARDLAQDVLVLLLEKLRAGEVREPGQIASFALGAARQLIVDRRRGERRRERLLDIYGSPIDTADEAAEPADVARLVPCLAGLSDRERTVLVLTFYQERTAAAVAEELGVTAGNVRVIRHRALERLRACLEAVEGRA